MAKEKEDKEENSHESEEKENEVSPELQNYRRLYAAAERTLKNDPNPETALESVDQFMANVLENSGTEQANHFLRVSLTKYVLFVMNRSDLNEQQLVALNDFLIKVMDLCIKLIHLDIRELYNILVRIFTPSMPIYKLEESKNLREMFSSRDAYEEQLQRHKIQHENINILRFEEPITVLYFVNVGYFLSNNGFGKIYDRIVECETVPLGLLKCMLKPIRTCHEVLSKAYLETYVIPLKNAVFEKLLNSHSGPIVREEKSFYGEISATIQGLLKRVMPQEQISPMVDQFNLDLGLKGFESNNLQRRLRGLKLITRMVKRAMAPKDETGRISSIILLSRNLITGTNNKEEEKKKIKPVEPSFVLNWLKKTDFVTKLFNENSHPAEIKHGILIPKFLATHNELKIEHIDMLWKLSLGKHESVQSTIFEALIELTQDLSLPLIQHLYENISAIKEYDSESLKLLAEFTPLAIERDGKNSYGMNVLYELCLDDSKYSPQLAESSLQHLVKLLKLNICIPNRIYYINQCANNIREHKSVPQSLELIKKILDCYPKRKKGRAKDSTKYIIESSRIPFVDILLQDLAHYKNLVKDLSPEELQSGDKKIGTITHMEHIKIRLGFLEYILSNSSLKLNGDQAEFLWDSLVTNMVVPEERSMCFRWLEQAKETKGEFCPFEENVIERLFTNKMTQMDATQLNLAGYTVFEQYFLSLNERSGRIRQIERFVTEGYSDYYTTTSDLLGIENMWRFALDSLDDEISRRATKCLNMLHQNVPNDNLKHNLERIRDAYISKSMEFLSSAENELRVTRCISLLKRLVEEFDVYGAKSARSVTGEITLFVKADKGNNFHIIIKQTETVGSLRQLIAEKYARSVNQLRITINNQELKDSDRTLEEIKIPDGQTVLVRHKQIDPKKELTKEEKFEEGVEDLTLRSLLLEVLQLQLHGLGLMSGVLTKAKQRRRTVKTSVQRDNFNPSNSLSTNHFPVIYKLLDASPIIASNVWSLLTLLPLNSKIVASLERTDELENNLQSHLSQTTIYKLTYTLKVFSDIIKRNQNPQSNQWFGKFTQVNGLKLLIQTFLNLELGNTLGHTTCFALLLRIINYFVNHDSSKLNGENLQDIVSRIIAISKFVSVPVADDPSVENNATIVKQAIDLLISCLKFNKDLVAHLFSRIDEENWLHVLLLTSPISKVRQETALGLCKLCRAFNDYEITSYFQRSSLKYLSTIESYPKTSDHFFFLLEKLNDINQEPEDINRLQALLLELISQIKKHPVLEASDSIEEQDTGLIGFMNFLRSIIRKDPKLKMDCKTEGLIDEIFTNCLFSIPTADNHGSDAPPKCKTKESRFAAYRLLVELAKDVPENYKHIHSLEMAHILTITPGDNWQIMAGSREKASHGYVGLQNLGATCYMNSLLQQLYMIPTFRQALLSVEDTSADINDSVLYQMQYLFSYLQESLKRSYNTTPFCQSYKDYDGNPINPAQQQDANEFFNMLFDKLEGYFAGTPKNGILKELFGGTLANQFISKECEHCSENTEQFYTIGVEIKNKKDILSSFELFIEGEMLSGESKYMCEMCDKRVDALKRCCIKTLPPILVIQLKRFEFDYDTMRNLKLNDRCAFPVELNMEPYTVEGIARNEAESDIRTSIALRASDFVLHPPEYYQYELRGIVVHTGTAECGHYYSFIKERVPLEGNTAHWFEFNDTSVSPWSINRLSSECFGGMEQYKQVNRQTGQTSIVDRPIANNAYILVYERKTKNLHVPKSIPIKLEDEKQDKKEAEKEDDDDSEIIEGKNEILIEEKKENSLLSHHRMISDEFEDNESVNNHKSSKQSSPSRIVEINNNNNNDGDEERRYTYDDIKAKVPDHIMTKIWQENQQFITERQVYDNNYFSYVWKLVNLYPRLSEDAILNSDDIPQIMLNIELSTRFIFDIYSHARDISMLPMWTKNLKNLYRNNIPGSLWLIGLLTRKRNIVRNILMECPIERTRKEVVELLDTTFRTLAPVEREFYRSQYQEFEDKKDAKLSVNDIKSWLVVFLESLVNLMHDVRIPRYVSSQYFQVFQTFIEISPEERKFFIHKKFHQILSDFIMGSGMFSEKKNNNNTTDAENAKLQFMKGPSGRRFGPPNITPAARTLVSLIKSMNFGPQRPNPPTCYADQEELFPTSEDEEMQFLHRNILLKLIKDCNDETVINDLIVHLSWSNNVKSTELMEILAEISPEFQMPSQVRNLFGYYTVLQDMQDTHQTERIDASLHCILRIIDDNLQNKDLCKNCGMFIATRQKQVPAIKQWVSKNHNLVSRTFNAAGFSLAK